MQRFVAFFQYLLHADGGMFLDGYAYIKGSAVPERQVLFLPLRHWTQIFWEKKKKRMRIHDY